MGDYTNQSNFIPKDRIYIEEQPIDCEIEAGQTATFSFLAGGNGTIKYQWYKMLGNTQIEIQGATEYSYTTDALQASDFNLQYFCIAYLEEEPDATVKSNLVKAINRNETEAIVITEQPEIVTIERGQSADFFIEAYGEFGSITYTWYYNEGTGAFKEVTSDIGQTSGNRLTTTTYNNEICWNRNYMCVISENGRDNKLSSNIVYAAEKQLDSINIIDGKTEYLVGEKINKSKLKLQAVYDDGSTQILTYYTLSNEDELTLEDSGNITVTWNGHTEPLSEITVVESTAYKIVMTSDPEKKVYEYNEKFDPTGMVIKAVYDDDSIVDVTGDVTIYGNNLTCENNIVKIQYGTLKIEYEVTVMCNWNEVETVAPTCTEKGYTKYECTVCGDTKNDNYVDELGHNIDTYISDSNATCEEDGTKTGKCTRCQEEVTVIDEGSKLEHDWEEKFTTDIEPTCTAPGSKSIHCTRCEKIKDITEIEELGHEFKNYVSNNDATCEEDGTKTAKCDRCSETNTIADVGSAKGHNWDEGKVTKEATCKEEGIKTYTCTVCGATKTEAIEKTTTHTWDNGKVTKEPTCKETGTKTYTCTVCGEKKTETIEKTTTHTWDNGKVTKEPTCKETGIKTYTCTVCGETKTETIEKTTTHTWDNGKVTTEPTCKEEGTKTYTCTVCGEKKTETIAKTTTHTWDNGKVTKEATCKETGTKIYTCTVCGETKTETIEKTAHNYVDGTCTECGKEDPDYKEPENLTVNSSEYKLESGYLSLIQPKTTVSMLKEEIITNKAVKTNAEKITVYKDDGKTPVGDTENLATGMKIEFTLGEQSRSYTIAVAGDVNGDGEADFKDIVLMNKHRLGKTTLSGAYLLAGDVTYDQAVDFKDIVKVNKYRLNKITSF